MRPSSRAALVSLFVVTALTQVACSPPPPCSGGAVPAPGIAPVAPNAVPLARVGSAFTHVATSRAGTGCTDSNLPSSARAEVKDPLNRDVEAELTFVGNAFPATALVTFTPTEPGPYYVNVRFEPNFDDVQADVLAVRDLSKNSPRRVPRACQRVQSLAHGALLCDTTIIRPDGSVGETLPSSATYVTSGGVIWGMTTGATGLRRWTIDETGTPSLSAELPASVAEPAHALATSDELIVANASSGQVHRFVHANGTLVGAGVLSSPSGVNPVGVFRPGSQLYVVEQSFNSSGRVDLCPVQVDGAKLVRQTPCTSIDGTFDGIEPSTVWVSRVDLTTFDTFGRNPVTVFTVTEANGQLVKVGHKLQPGFTAHRNAGPSLAEGGPVLINRQPLGFETGAPAMLVPRSAGGDLTFDLLSEGAALPIGAGVDLAWKMVPGNAGTDVFRRDP